jgi:hypothetical protein
MFAITESCSESAKFSRLAKCAKILRVDPRPVTSKRMLPGDQRRRNHGFGVKYY